jgi:hypothetical protein
LLSGLLHEARRLGFGTVYCATSTAASLLERQGWRLLATALHDGKPVRVFSSAASPAPNDCSDVRQLDLLVR